MNPFTVSLFVGCAALCVGPVSALTRFEVDLDEHPRKRWTHVTNYWKDHMLARAPSYHKKLIARLGSDFDEWCRVADNAFDKEAEEELIGITHSFSDPFLGNLTLMKLNNMLYEVNASMGCTGLLWAMEDGSVIHGRGVDELGSVNAAAHHVKDFDVIFKKSGRPLYIATMTPGTIGTGTAMRFDGWSFAQNTRFVHDVKKNMAAAKQGGKVLTLVSRRVMESTPDFETAVQRLYDEKYASPQYFIVGGKGPYEGAVLSLDRLGKHEKDTPPIRRLEKEKNHAWHLLQTNDDFGHDPLDMRRFMGDMELAAMDQKQVNVTNMFNFLRAPPFFHPMTVFTNVMVPSTGYFHTILTSEESPVVSTALGIKESLLEAKADVKPHLHYRQQQLRGAYPELLADVSSFLQLSSETNPRKTDL